MLISRIASSSGVTSMVKEPLNQSSSIDNPQRSQAMSQAMGMPGEGFGTSPLDANRQFLTPDFYKKYLRKTQMSQESADEQGAFNRLLTEGQIPAPAQGSYSFATLKGQERQMQVENAAEGLASRLETLRARGARIILPLPPNIIGKDVLDKLYNDKGKKQGLTSLYSLETIQDMRPTQLLIALNLATIALPFGYTNLASQVRAYTWGSEDKPATTLITDLKEIVQFMNKGEPNISIPLASATASNLNSAKLVNILQNIKTSANDQMKREYETAHKEYVEIMKKFEASLVYDRNDPLVELRTKINTPGYGRGGAGMRQVRNIPVNLVPLALARDIAQTETPGAPGVARNPDSMSKAELQEALTAKGVVFSKKLGEKNLRKLLRDNP